MTFEIDDYLSDLNEICRMASTMDINMVGIPMGQTTLNMCGELAGDARDALPPPWVLLRMMAHSSHYLQNAGSILDDDIDDAVDAWLSAHKVRHETASKESK